MAKDSFWFKHDSAAGRGLRIRKIQHIYGHWGKGIYWDVCEILREQENYKHEKDDSSLQMLSDIIGCSDSARFINWYKDCVELGLLIEGDNVFYSPALTDRMKVWEVKKSNGNQGGRGHKKANLKLNESETKANLKLNESIREEKRREEDIEKREELFKKGIRSLEVSDKEKSAFFNYWSEKSKNGKRMKWELEKTWDLKKRMQRWVNNNFNKEMASKPRVPLN